MVLPIAEIERRLQIWVRSRSEGAGKATRPNARGLTRSVIARIIPPLPAASRPSKSMTTRTPVRAKSYMLSFSLMIIFASGSSRNGCCCLPLGDDDARRLSRARPNDDPVSPENVDELARGFVARCR